MCPILQCVFLSSVKPRCQHRYGAAVGGRLYESRNSDDLKMPRFLPCMCSNVELDELQDQMKKLLEKQSFITTWDPETMLPPHTDVILEANDGRLVHAHKTTLMGKSVQFKTMLAGLKDIENPQVVKMDMDHQSLEAFIHFFYSGFVREDAMTELADKLLRASDRYGIVLLHDLCQEKLMTLIHPDRIFQYFLLGSKCRAEHLVHAIISFVANNYGDISEIHGYNEFLKDDPTLVAKLCNGVVRKLKARLNDHHVKGSIIKRE